MSRNSGLLVPLILLNSQGGGGGGGTTSLADGGTGSSLADPGADRLLFWDDSAGAVDWLTLGTNLSISGTTLNAAGGGLSEPIDTARFTKRSAAPSAAASGEALVYTRNLATSAVVGVTPQVGDSQILLPSFSNPLVRSIYAPSSGAILVGHGQTAGGNQQGTVSLSSILTRLSALNFASAASSNAYAGFLSGSNNLKPGSAIGEGFLTWGMFYCPDASYGSGSTGSVISCGVNDNAGYWPTNTGRPAAAQTCALLEYNTNQSDTNFQFIVCTGAAQNIVDSGMPFAAQHVYFYAIYCPRGGSSTYFTIKDVTADTTASGSLAAVPGSTSILGEHIFLQTLSATARQIRVKSASTIIGVSL